MAVCMIVARRLRAGDVLADGRTVTAVLRAPGGDVEVWAGPGPEWDKAAGDAPDEVLVADEEVAVRAG